MNGTDHLLKKKDKKVVVVIKAKLVGNFIKDVFELRAKTCSYLIDDGSEYKKDTRK